MASKLTEITTQYHSFEDNQVLTKDQLNEFINYFEDQDRISRIFLSGVGIVCGFSLKINAAKTIITITQGTGVSTDGDLFKLKNNIAQSALKSIDLNQIQYTHFKTFEDSYAGYSFFKKLVNENGKITSKSMDLLELLPETGENTSLINTLPNLNDKVVLLYLESYPKGADLCTSIDCDNQGVEQVARLRVLLVSKADAALIAGNDTIFSKHDVADDYFKLPEVAVRRVVLNGINSSSYEELKRAYYQSLINKDNLLVNLKNGISKMLTDFDSVLNLNLPKSVLPILLSKLESILKFSAYTVPFNIQYRYDCIKDIVDTYNKIKCLLLALKEECCPDIKAFPKHLMLGCLSEIQSDVQHYRHKFYKSPILNCGTDKIEQSKSLVTRLFEIIGQFSTSIGETKITPSNKLLELTHRTIPFYYNVQSGLLSSWNYFKTEKNKQDTNLCYHTTNLSPALHIQNPLNFNTDKFDFYRIEGHQGKDYKLVLEEIDELKTKHGLAFDVKALSVNINSENLNVDDYLCEFEDLNVLLRAWTAEQECVLAEVSGFFSGFSIVVPGENVKEPQLNLTHKAFEVAADTGRVEAAKFTEFNIAKSNIRFAAAAEEIKIEPLTFMKSEVISENLTTNKDALGSVMKIAFEETKGGSVNDIIAKTQGLVAERINTEEWKNQPEIKTFVIDQSIELMAHAHILSQKMPTTLTNVSIAQVDTYKTTMANLCALVKKMKASYQTVELSVGLKAFIGIFINQLSIVCCSGKKLQILLEEINKRKESILVRLQLSKFVEKNPGLEHRAGVQPGGTFVLVYLNKVQLQVSKENIVAEKLKTNENIFNARTAITDLKARTNILAFDNPISKSSGLIRVEKLLKNDNLKLLERFIRTPDLANNTVVADFSLPYMCCSDCAPVNFIIAKPPVSLRLEKDEFCLGKDTSPLLFEVSPEDGIIKADPETAGVTIDGVKLILDTKLFPDEMLGKPIHFTVNDQITETQITIYRAVEFDFVVPESPTSESPVNFRPSGKLDGATFLWSFGDDNLSTERNPTHTYKLPVNEANKVTVSLTVTAPNGVCQNTVEHDIEFTMEKTKISLEKDNFCENDEKTYPFAITPAGAKAKIEGSGVEQDDSGEFVFIPAKAPLGEITFTLNGTPSGVTITVNEAPVAKFEPSQVEKQLILTNNSTGADSYIWVINGKEFESFDNKPLIIELTEDSPTLWTLQLRAISKNCGTSTTKEIRFETSIKDEEIKIELEKTTFCESDKKSYLFNVIPAGAKAKIEGSGVQQDDSGAFIFVPTVAKIGEIEFSLNSVPSGVKVTVSKAPFAKFVAAQIKNQLVLTNTSTGADSYVWSINGAKTNSNNTLPIVIDLTPNSPTLWTLQLLAISEVCGENNSAVTRLETKFNDETPVDNCAEETKAAVLIDLNILTKQQNPDSEFVQQIWKTTSELYGGTAEFKNGVLNDIDNYISGKNNNKLEAEFVELLIFTSNVIGEIDRIGRQKEFDQLAQLFGLQLRLFYNILGCQNTAAIKAFTEVLQNILNQIIDTLRFLKEVKVTMPNSLKEFMKTYSDKVKDIGLLLEHLKIIITENLI